LAITYPAGSVLLPTEAGWDHLVYASAGVMTVETASDTWVLPSHRALLLSDTPALPSGYSCTGRSRSAPYFQRWLAVLAAELQVLNVPPLVRELILAAVAEAPLNWRLPEHRRLVEVIADRLKTLPQAPLQLPMPSDPRALALAAPLREVGDLRESLDQGAMVWGPAAPWRGSSPPRPP